MATYLINAPHNQTISTQEHGRLSCLVYSNPLFFKPKSLAQDFGDIGVGDEVILCRDSVLKSIATISEVIDATDASDNHKYRGKPVSRPPCMGLRISQRQLK